MTDTPQRVFDGAHLRVLHLRRGCDKLMVTFDFRTIGKSDFGPVNISQGFANAGFDQLMIKTKTNDWFINADTADMETLLPSLAAPYARVHALGFSMGGYGALRFAHSLGADFVMTVSPQISIDPAVVPFDRRYRTEAQTFDPRQGALPPLTQMPGIVLYDPFVAADRRHAAALSPLTPQMTQIRASFGGHPATQALREGGRAGAIQRAAMQLISPAQLRRAHRAARTQSATYMTRLARAAAHHHPTCAEAALSAAQTLGQNTPPKV